MLGNRNDVRTGDLGDGDTAIGLVRGIQVDVVRADTSRDGDLQLLGFGEALCGKITGVEAGE